MIIKKNYIIFRDIYPRNCQIVAKWQLNIKILAIIWRLIGGIRQNFFPNIKYKIFPLLRQKNFYQKAPTFI